MNPELKKIPKEFEQTIKNDIDPFIMVGFWYALFRLTTKLY